MKKLFACLFAIVGLGVPSVGCAVAPDAGTGAGVEESEDVGQAEQASSCRPWPGVICEFDDPTFLADCYCSEQGPCAWLADNCDDMEGTWQQDAAGQWFCHDAQGPC